MVTIQDYREAKAEYLRLDEEEKRIKKAVEEELSRYGNMDRRFRLRLQDRLESQYGLYDVWKAKIEVENRLLEIGKEAIKMLYGKYGMTPDYVETAFEKIHFHPIYREKVLELVLNLEKKR